LPSWSAIHSFFGFQATSKTQVTFSGNFTDLCQDVVEIRSLVMALPRLIYCHIYCGLNESKENIATACIESPIMSGIHHPNELTKSRGFCPGKVF